MKDAISKLADEFEGYENRVRGGARMETNLAYRNGWLDAISYMTGEDSESLYERVQDILQARHERRISEMEV